MVDNDGIAALITFSLMLLFGAIVVRISETEQGMYAGATVIAIAAMAILKEILVTLINNNKNQKK